MSEIDSLKSAIQQLNRDLACIDRALDLVQRPTVRASKLKQEHRLVWAMASGGLSMKKEEIKNRINALQKKAAEQARKRPAQTVRVGDDDVLDILAAGTKLRSSDIAMAIIRKTGCRIDDFALVREITAAVSEGLQRLKADRLVAPVGDAWCVTENDDCA